MYKFWSNLHKLPWSSLRFWNHNRQKTVRVSTWNWKSNIIANFVFWSQVFHSSVARKSQNEKSFIAMKKNLQTQGRNFLNFCGLSWSYLGSKSNLHPTHKNISYGYANFEIVYFVPLYISISSMNRVFEAVPFSFNSGSIKNLT